MSIYDGPQLPDERPPGYGCGPSFGMLGPTRLLVKVGEFAAPSPLNRFYCCRLTQTDPPAQAEWAGEWGGGYSDGALITVRLNRWEDSEGMWTLYIDVDFNEPTLSGYASWTIQNFTWQKPAIGGPDNFLRYAQSSVKRVAEWQTMTALNAAVLFPIEL